jgi:hypothetical protein
MTKKPPISTNIIEQMIDLRIQQSAIEKQIEALKPAFYEACNQQDIDRIENGRALIYWRLTPGKWDYSYNIIEHEQKLKQLKLDFQETHEPVTGREVSWVIRLAVDKTASG